MIHSRGHQRKVGTAVQGSSEGSVGARDRPRKETAAATAKSLHLAAELRHRTGSGPADQRWGQRAICWREGFAADLLL